MTQAQFRVAASESTYHLQGVRQSASLNEGRVSSASVVVRKKILIVDDLEDARWVLSRIVEQAEFTPMLAASGEQALELIQEQLPDLILLDVQLSGIDGFEVLTRLKKQEKSIPVIMITAYSKTYDATRAVRAGAYDFVTKPFNNEDILLTIQHALQEKGLRRQPRSLSRAPSRAKSLMDLMGHSAAIECVMRDVRQVGPTNFSVLIMGETGSGKELVAKAVHAESLRSDKPFVVVDCGAIPANLIESELFGYEKGAFTGATQAKAGAFELADGGAIFLDEIGNLPLAMQSSLLRVLETHRIRRLGSVVERPVDFRLVAATNENLHAEVNQSSFRRDLYHRLAEFTISLPPLRARKDDVPFLVQRFISEANIELGRKILDLTDQAWRVILRYDWPGNVRELRNQLRRAVLLSEPGQELIGSELFGIFDMGEVTPDAKKCDVSAASCESDCPLPSGVSQCQLVQAPRHMTVSQSMSLKDIVHETVVNIERVVLERAIELTGGNKAEAARLLHVDYKTMQSKLNGYGISINKIKKKRLI